MVVQYYSDGAYVQPRFEVQDEENNAAHPWPLMCVCVCVLDPGPQWTGALCVCCAMFYGFCMDYILLPRHFLSPSQKRRNRSNHKLERVPAAPYCLTRRQQTFQPVQCVIQVFVRPSFD